MAVEVSGPCCCIKHRAQTPSITRILCQIGDPTRTSVRNWCGSARARCLDHAYGQMMSDNHLGAGADDHPLDRWGLNGRRALPFGGQHHPLIDFLGRCGACGLVKAGLLLPSTEDPGLKPIPTANEGIIHDRPFKITVPRTRRAAPRRFSERTADELRSLDPTPLKGGKDRSDRGAL